MKKHIQKIITLGPATNSQAHFAQMKKRGVDFVRTNMSHSSLEEMERFMDMAEQEGIPFIVDTEGSQVRTGQLGSASIHFVPGDEFRIYAEALVGDRQKINLTPPAIVGKLQPGDI